MTKNREHHFGYKNHANADAATKLITKFTTGSANVHDSQRLEELIDHTDQRLFADSAYAGEKIDNWLWHKNVQNFIQEKGYRNHPLTFEQKQRNTLKSKVRSKVEHIFGFMTNSMHNGLNLTYNLFRYEQLVRLQKVKRM